MCFSGKFKNTCFPIQSRTMARKKRNERVLPVPKMRKRLDIAILGVPNVGKSVLLNAMLKTKLAATSRKKHTTRMEILGVFNHRNTQLAFYDTPGYTRKDDTLKDVAKSLRAVATGAAQKADVVLLMVDATKCKGLRYQDTFAEMAKIAINSAKLEVILVINKVDLIEPKTLLLKMTRELIGLINYAKLGVENAHLAELDTTTFMISAIQNDGVLDVKNYLLSIAQPKPWALDSELGPTDMSNEERVEEMVLQMLMENTHEEIPYIAEIRCKQLEMITDTRVKIDVDILVDTASQVRILVGQQARTLVKVRQDAVKQLEQIFGREVILQFQVNPRKKSDRGEE